MGQFSTKLSEFLVDHQQSFMNLVLVALTLGGEQAFRLTAFECPCTQPNALLFGLVFLGGPFTVLLILGFLVNNVTWLLCQGCTHRDDKTGHGCPESCTNCCMVLSKAIVAPMAWVFIALLDGTYYTCMVSDQPCVLNSYENKTYMAISQMIAWGVLTVVMIIAMLAICITRCQDRQTYLRWRYISLYQDAEKHLFEHHMKEKVCEKAKANASLFLDREVICKKDWDKISKAPIQKMDFDEQSKIEPVCTHLQKWVEDSDKTVCQERAK